MFLGGIWNHGGARRSVRRPLLEGKVRHFVGQFFSFSGGWA